MVAPPNQWTLPTSVILYCREFVKCYFGLAHVLRIAAAMSDTGGNLGPPQPLHMTIEVDHLASFEMAQGTQTSVGATGPLFSS